MVEIAAESGFWLHANTPHGRVEVVAEPVTNQADGKRKTEDQASGKHGKPPLFYQSAKAWHYYSYGKADAT